MCGLTTAPLLIEARDLLANRGGHFRCVIGHPRRPAAIAIRVLVNDAGLALVRLSQATAHGGGGVALAPGAGGGPSPAETRGPASFRRDPGSGWQAVTPAKLRGRARREELTMAEVRRSALRKALKLALGYDLDDEKVNCQTDEIIRAGHDKPFATHAEAKAAGYDNCAWCIGGSTT